MAYNNLSGTVLAPHKIIPRKDRNGDIIVPILSGNLSTSDGASILNIPRLSNATNNAIITNVGGDANTLTCESNLTFDGSTLAVTGDLTGSGAGAFATLNLNNGVATIGLDGATTLGTITATTISGTYGYFKNDVTSSAGGKFATLEINNGSAAISAEGSLRLSSSAYLNWGNTVGASGYGLRDNNGTIQFRTSTGSWTDVGTGGSGGGGGSATAQGPENSLQFHTTGGTISGSANLIFSSSILSVSGGIVFNRIQSTANMTASATDYFIAINTNSNPVDIRLPSAALLASGQTYVIKDEGGTANTNNITVYASGSQTIDGQNSVVLESPYASIQLYCNGSDKYFIF